MQVFQFRRSWYFLTAIAVLLAIGAGMAFATDHRTSTRHPESSRSAKEQPGFGQQHTTGDLVDVHAAAVAFGNKYGPDRVLVVLDVDNTLLAMNQDLGSDQWFGWQRDLIEANPDSPNAVARDFPGLLDAQGLLFTLSQMHPPQKEAPELVSDLQQRGFPMVALTSRSEDFRTATERELLRNGFQLAKTALPVNAPVGRVFMPYDLSNLAASNLLSEEVKHFELGKPRRVSYSAGVYMVAGQHKGAMLLTLLARCTRQISAIVFVDDRPRHTQRVHDAVARRGVIEVATFRYSHEDDRVVRFNASDKSEVVRGWQQLQKTLHTVFR